MPYLTANPSHYNAIYDYCQDSGLFYSLPNEPDFVVFGNHSLYGTSINPEIIYYYDTLCTIFVSGRLHDYSELSLSHSIDHMSISVSSRK